VKIIPSYVPSSIVYCSYVESTQETWRQPDNDATPLPSRCLFSYFNHGGITLVGKRKGVLPDRFRTQYFTRY
jgi:hypothetical protein